MIRYLTATALTRFPKLADTMYRDRATQFSDRLRWAVQVDDKGWERDSYDALDPIYAIWQRPDGSHGGSMRFLPTLGRTMVNDHFSDLAGRPLRDPLIWECTRFCLAPAAGPRVSAALMLAGAQLGVGLGLTHAVGVFDARMVRVYRTLGWSPRLLGTKGKGRDAISVGLWRFDPAVLHRLGRAAHLKRDLTQLWFARAFSTETLRHAA